MSLPEVGAILQSLLRFDTQNPPGNEGPCAAYAAGLVRQVGLEPRLLGRVPGRESLVVRLPGRGAAAPLLLYGHLDVVTVQGQQWAHPPFSGHLDEHGYLWGRGALDMKGAVAMMLSAVLEARRSGVVPAGDVVLALVADEESGGSAGASYLVDEHPELFAGVRHALGEFGGFTFRVGGVPFYPIQVNEKQCCHVRATVRGPGGHGSAPRPGGTIAALARLLTALDGVRLPPRPTTPFRMMVNAMADELPDPAARALRALASPATAAAALPALGELGELLSPLVADTACPTGVACGSALNVIPSEASVDLDCRLVPGASPEEVLVELHAALGPGVALEVVSFEPGPPGEPDMTLYPLLAGILRDLAPEARPCPFLQSGATDGRHLARLGIQTYGFTPLRLPEEFAFVHLTHAADERVPVAALEFGAEALGLVLRRYA